MDNKNKAPVNKTEVCPCFFGVYLFDVVMVTQTLLWKLELLDNRIHYIRVYSLYKTDNVNNFATIFEPRKLWFIV